MRDLCRAILVLLLLLVSVKGSPRDAWLDILHRLYDQVEHRIGFCFGRDPLDMSRAMEESFDFPKQSIADHVCFNSSVLVKSLCGPKEIEVYYKFMLLTQNPEKIPSTSVCPATEVNKAECLPGFFGYDEGMYHPCCDGYFCPRGLNCMMPCPKGSLCLRATPRPPPKRFPQESYSYWCAPFAYKRRMDLPCGGADTWSIIPQDAFPGVESWKYGSGNMYCPKRYFCPNTTTKIACPRGHYCKQGSTAPQPCPLGSFCPDKTEVPLSNYGGVSADVLLLSLLAMIWFVSKQYSQIMCSITHQDRLRIQWRPFPPRLRVAPKKNHRMECDTAVCISSDAVSGIDSEEDVLLLHGDADEDIDVAFFHVSMELVSHTRKALLYDVSGRFEKRKVTAILGPSGAGKSSLLSLLGGRASSYAVQTTGHILVNGKEDNMKTLKGNLGYVPQDDIMYSTLTVKENLLYAARFGMKSGSTWEDHQHAVFETILLLQLRGVQNELVGDPSSKYGISGGQKKRVNIGLEMVQKPKVLFLDEPTSGLDSNSAFSLIQSLREIATERRVTTCAVLHQPRNECFYLCDNVLLMASGGTSVYYGRTHSVEKHFESLGFHLPIHTNPADFIVDVISTKEIDFSICMDELMREYTQEYPESAVAVLPMWSHDEYGQQATIEEECPLYSSDDNENIFVLRDTSIISKVLKTFAISFASLELKTPLLGKRTEHDNSNRQIAFFRQAYWFIQRAALHRTREPLEAMADYIMVVLTGLTVGLLSDRGKSTIMSYASQVSYAVVALGLIATVSTTTTFTTHALMIKREYQSSGISKLAYFMALDAFDMIGSCIKSILFLAGWASFASPRATWMYLYMVTVFIFYSCAGISYALSLYLGESSSQLAAAIITLISTLVARQPDPGIFMILLQSISFPRFAMEGFLIAESNQLKGVWLLARCADLHLLHYDVRNFYIDLAALFLLGVALRIIALEKLLRM